MKDVTISIFFSQEWTLHLEVPDSWFSLVHWVTHAEVLAHTHLYMIHNSVTTFCFYGWTNKNYICSVKTSLTPWFVKEWVKTILSPLNILLCLCLFCLESTPAPLPTTPTPPKKKEIAVSFERILKHFFPTPLNTNFHVLFQSARLTRSSHPTVMQHTPNQKLYLPRHLYKHCN